MRTLRLLAVLLMLAGPAGAAAAPGGAPSLDAGARLMSQKRYAEAVRAFEREASAHPGSSAVLLNLGWAYWHARRPRDARRIGSTLYKLDPENPTFLTFYANTEVEAKRFASAAELARKALKLSPGSKEAAMVLSRALFRAGRQSEAMRELDRIVKAHPEDADARYRRAMFQAEQGKTKEALEALDALVKADPANAMYRRSRARVLSQVGRGEEAKSEWEDLTKKAPDAESLLNLGWAYWREGRSEEALKIAHTLLKLDDKNPVFLRFMANMQIERMEYGKAIALSEKALQLAPGDRDATLTLARALFRENREHEATARLQKLVERFPGDPAVSYLWAEVLGRNGRHQEALLHLDRLVKAEPANIRYRMVRAQILAESGQHDKAVEEFKKLAAVPETAADAAARLRDDAYNRKDWEEAAQWQKSVIAANPKEPAAWERLSRLYTSMGKDALAAGAAEKAIAVDPLYTSAYYLRAESLEALSDWPKALEAYEDVCVRNPNSVRGLEGLSRVLEMMGRHDDAIEALRRIEELTAPSISPFLRIRMARLMADKGDPRGARRILDEIVKDRRTPIPVLMYHGISKSERGDSISQSQFREQMRALKAAGYQPMTASELDKVLRGKVALPVKPILITFDDGRSDSFENADPVLKEVGFRVTMFVHLTKLRKPGFHSSVDEMRKWQANGRWELQAHGDRAHDPTPIDEAGRIGHFLPNRMWLDDKNRLETPDEYRQRVELDYKKAKEGVEAITGGEAVAFAYPYGDYGQNDYSNNPKAASVNQALVRKYFRLAFIQEPYGVNTIASHPTDLRRFEVPRHMTAGQLLARISGNDPWVLARLTEASLYARAEQFGRAQAVLTQLREEGLDEPRLWTAQAASLARVGDVGGARALYLKAYTHELTKGGPVGPREATARRLLEQARDAAAPRGGVSAERFTDSNTSERTRTLARGSAAVKKARLSLFGGPGSYDDRLVDADGVDRPQVRSREAGLGLRLFPAESVDVGVEAGRRDFTEGAVWGAGFWTGSASWRALPRLTATLRTSGGNVDVAEAIRAMRTFRSFGGGAAVDIALDWRAFADFDQTAYDDGNRSGTFRGQVTRRFTDALSLGASYVRADSTRASPEYFAPRELQQYAGLVRLTRPWGPVSARTGQPLASTLLQYEGGWGRQAPTDDSNGQRVVHGVRGGFTLRAAERVSLELDGRYSQSPRYISRQLSGGVTIVF
jgi:predicted Zn-dependent protease